VIVRRAWAKYSKLAPVLTSRRDSLKVHWNVYTACIQEGYGISQRNLAHKDGKHTEI